MRRAAILAVAVTALSCYATHEYRDIRAAPAHPEPLPEVLPVRVAMVAGTVRLGRAAGDSLYELHVRVCRSHFTPKVAAVVPEAPAIDVGLRRRPGRLPAVPVDEERNAIDLGLSPRVASDIRLDLGAGRHQVDLGGLRVAGLQVAVGSGELDLDFGSAVAQSPSSMLIQGGTGYLHVHRIGNASPGTLLVQGGSGSIEIDLSGSWIRDAAVTIDARLADVVMTIPEGLAVSLDAEGRDPADLSLPGFRRDPDGRWIGPWEVPGGRRVEVRLLPGIGRFETRPPGPATGAPPAASSLLAPTRSDITPTL